jgi:hypothetical protein
LGYANSIALAGILIFEDTNWSGALFISDREEFSSRGRFWITTRLKEMPMSCTS